MKLLLLTGCDAPNRQAGLKIVQHYRDAFSAYYEPGFCGCEDCHWIVGAGKTEAEARADYWDQWASEYELEAT